jgi:hypothetical protein
MYQEQINIIKNASLSIIFLLAFSFLAWADETNKNLILFLDSECLLNNYANLQL